MDSQIVQQLWPGQQKSTVWAHLNIWEYLFKNFNAT